jgi:hypothetical protein
MLTHGVQRERASGRRRQAWIPTNDVPQCLKVAVTCWTWNVPPQLVTRIFVCVFLRGQE